MMLAGNDLMAFLATSDPAKALAFYQDALGLTLIADEEYALVFEANGTMLRVQKVASVAAAPYTALGWSTQAIDEDVAGLTARGVVFERFEGMEQDTAGIWTAPGGARVAWFKDPDGNLLSLTEFRD